MIGIYKITYKKDGRTYIGQSVNIEHRLKEHKKCEGDSYIHRAIKKYGIENFSFEIIEECKISKLDEREKYWISFYNSFNCGFNQTPGGQGFQNQVAVDCFNFNGDRVATYPSLIAAQEATGACQISACINGKRKQSGGFQWKRHEDANEFIDIYHRVQYSSRAVSQFDLNDKWIADFDSIMAAARTVFHTDNGSLRRRIKKACENDMGVADGFKWKYHKRSEVAALADLLD